MSNLIERFVAGREVSGLPLSIATSLAIESACGVHPEIPVKVAPVTSYQRLYINIRTLIRNVYGAVNGDVKKQLTAEHVFPAILEELIIIESAINQASKGNCQVIYYFCKYPDIRSVFPHANLKADQTPIKAAYVAMETGVLSMIMKNRAMVKQKHPIEVYENRVEADARNNKALMLTHIPSDLLYRNRFAYLWLLESHTGAIKNAAQWTSKLTNGKELTRIPFNRITLQVFGDNGNQFSPMPMKVKDSFKDLAEKNNWTAITTVEKIIFDIKNGKDKGLVDLVNLLK
jgi:hypothetical protein